VTRRERGFSLIELMAAMAMSVILGGILFATATRMMKANVLATAYAEDVLGARRVLASMERDLRNVTPALYRLADDGTVLRIVDGRPPAPLARNVARLETRLEDALIRIVLELKKRDATSPRRPIFVSAVAIRAERTPR
jgi:prepilin-type N-terminal cleavage/methylation domain-containing protein